MQSEYPSSSSNPSDSAHHSPLVSIIVITYNSAKFVLETLESAKSQTYQNIELIVSDDGSKDDTVELCREWLVANDSRFVRTELLTVAKNTGIPANCNRGVRASQGEWVKLIAGDDILVKEAISMFLNFALDNSSQFVVSDLIYFNEKKILAKYGSPKEINRFFSFGNAGRKYRSYIRNSVFLNIPGIFYNRSVYDLNEGYDEEFRMIEDIPFIIRSLKNNIDINYLPDKMVFYRIHEKSATGLASDNLLKDIYGIFIKYKKKNLLNGDFIDLIFYYNYVFNYFLKRKGLNRNFVFKIYFKLTSFLRLLS